MESHPLNLAHQQHRRADAHLSNHRYDEAMQCHHNAAELLLDAMKSTTSSVALESISLQHSYHLKQKDLIKSKKEQYVRVKKAMENIKLLGKDTHLNLQGNDYTKLQVAIYRAINESESRLQILSSNKKDVTDGMVKENTKPVDVTDGKKTEKSQQTVIEELQILSQNLHSLVEQLLLQVEVLKDENVTLKERLTYLEKERVKYLNIASTDGGGTMRDNIIPGHEGLTSDLAKVESNSAGTSVPIVTTIERQNQQLNFDLSALK